MPNDGEVVSGLAPFSTADARARPDRAVVEIPDEHEVFHVLYDLGGPGTRGA